MSENHQNDVSRRRQYVVDHVLQQRFPIKIEKLFGHPCSARDAGRQNDRSDLRVPWS